MSEKGKGKGKEKGEKPPEKPVDEELTNAVLKDIVKELEATRTHLLQEVANLTEKLRQQKDDQADIYFFLNKKCDENYETIAELEGQILREQTDRENSERAYEKKIEELQNKLESDEFRYLNRIKDLEDRLAILQDYAIRKEDQEKELVELKSTIERERKEFADMKKDIEKKSLLDRDKLRREYDHKKDQLKVEVETIVEERLSKKTKKVQVVNTMIKKEMSNQSKEADKVLEFNRRVLQRDNELQIQLQVAQSTEVELTNRLVSYQSIIRQLNERIIAEDAEFVAERSQHEEAIHRKDEEIDALKAQLQQQSAAVGDTDQMWSFMTKLYNKLEERGESRHWQDDNASVASLTHQPSVGKEQMLVKMFQILSRRYPKKFQSSSSSSFWGTTSLLRIGFPDDGDDDSLLSNNHHSISSRAPTDKLLPPLPGTMKGKRRMKQFTSSVVSSSSQGRLQGNNNNNNNNNNSVVGVGSLWDDSNSMLSIEESVHNISSALSIGDSIKQSQISAEKSSLAKSLLAGDDAYGHTHTVVHRVGRKPSVRTDTQSVGGGSTSSVGGGLSVVSGSAGSMSSSLPAPVLGALPQPPPMVDMTDSPAPELVDHHPLPLPAGAPAYVATSSTHHSPPTRQVSIPSKRNNGILTGTGTSSSSTTAHPFRDQLLQSTRMTPQQSRRDSTNPSLLLDSANSVGSLTSSLGSGSIGGSPVSYSNRKQQSRGGKRLLQAKKMSTHPSPLL